METLRHIPPWVGLLLLALVALGIRQSLPHRLTLRRSAILPVAMVGLSLAGVATGFASQPLALLAWAKGLAATLLLLRGRIGTSAVRFDAASSSFAMPGSWIPMALFMAIFGLKFAAGALLATHPPLAGSLPFAAAMSAAYGALSGIFLARAIALWSVARRDGVPQPA